MIWGKLHLTGRNQLEDTFGAIVGRANRKRRRDERRLAEQRATRHQIQAKNSCIADARSYRVARLFPISAIAELDWK